MSSLASQTLYQIASLGKGLVKLHRRFCSHYAMKIAADMRSIYVIASQSITTFNARAIIFLLNTQNKFMY